MIEKDHPKLSLRKQCELLEINRNRLTQRKSKVSEEDEQIMKVLDVIYTEWPFLGQRKLQRELVDHGWKIGRKRVRRLMKVMGIEAHCAQAFIEHPKQKSQAIPLLVEGSESDRSGSSVVHRHHLPTDGEGSCLPCGNHGLEEPSCPVLGAE